MPKFFITNYDLAIGNTAYILGEDARHIRKSLRRKAGDHIYVCDGKGEDFVAKITNLESDAVRVRIIDGGLLSGESSMQINLYTAITKGEGFEYSLRKCVEAGVYSINPMITERTVVDIPSSKIEKRTERWNKIALEAAKQSGRSLIPQVAYPKNFQEVIHNLEEADFTIICYVNEGTLSLNSVFMNHMDARRINVLIGPEGGFTENEWGKAVLKGALSVTLGKRVLKAETAGLFVTAITMYAYGELDKK